MVGTAVPQQVTWREARLGWGQAVDQEEQHLHDFSCLPIPHVSFCLLLFVMSCGLWQALHQTWCFHDCRSHRDVHFHQTHEAAASSLHCAKLKKRLYPACFG